MTFCRPCRAGRRHRAGAGAAAGIAVGQSADLVVLDAQHVALRGLPAPAMLSAHVFASHRTSAIDSVWVAGSSVAGRPPCAA